MLGSKKSQILLNSKDSFYNKNCMINLIYNTNYLINPKKSNNYITPVKDEHLKTDNYLSEYATKAEQMLARLNLGIDGIAYWGKIQGYLEDLLDLYKYIHELSNTTSGLIINRINNLSGADIKGGFQSVSTIEDLNNIPTNKLEDGMLAFVQNELKHYVYIAEKQIWKAAKFGNSGLSLFTNDLLQQQDPEDIPDEYIYISNNSDLNGHINNKTYTTSTNGTYVDILFKAIRSLLAEVAKLKNSFNYGIQSYTGTSTANSEIIYTEESEEQEPLWAIDPEDLNEFDDYSIIINSETSLLPINHINFDNENYLEIGDSVSLEVALDFNVSTETKQCVYIIADTKSESKININLYGFNQDTGENNSLVLNLNQWVSKSKCNILLVINRSIFNEDANKYIGNNYIWIQVTDRSGNVIKTGYINNNELSSFLIKNENRYYVQSVNFKNINLYRCSFYGKDSGFTNEDIISSRPDSDNFVYKAAHITIRSVNTKETLLALQTRLMPNELIYVESEKLLYIKSSNNELISLSSGQTTNNTTMTEDQLLNLLKEAGYLTTDGKLDTAKLNAIEELTFVHTESNQLFNLKVNSDGKLIIDKESNMTPDRWHNEQTEYTGRGTVGHYTLNNNYETTNSIDLYGQSNDPKAYGDRVRFGSWYIPKKDQTEFGCSHDFIELANSGSVDYPLDGSRLFLIRGDVVTENANSYLIDASILKFILTGLIKSGSTYLIRGEKHQNANIVNIDSYDYELRDSDKQLVSLQGVVAMILLNASTSDDISLITGLHKTSDSKDIYYLSKHLYSTNDKDEFDYKVLSDLIDGVALEKADAFRSLSSGMDGNKNAISTKNYGIPLNCIVKDSFELDPSRLGFLSLTTTKFESTGNRIAKINSELLNLSNNTISFPHSDEEAEIVRFTPKASYLNKTVCTDKTPLNTDKPNMVSCFFGIDMQTTRCFNWVSTKDQNEYVWIRKKGDSVWNRFESYKGDQSEIATSNDVFDINKMNRVKYTREVIDKVYKRLKGVFPGSNYQYTAHKCIVFIDNAVTTPTTYEYVVGPTLNNELPNLDKCSNVQTFTLYPDTWKPIVYLISDQQGFNWTEYQVWAAAAKLILKQINEECTSETNKFPVLINTGDCTQNGTRYNEWLDYYNAGYCLFDHLELLNVVGNNDLANAYNHSVLGTGNDEGKSNPYYFHLMNCYELDNTHNYENNDDETNLYKKMWTHPLICNGLFFPSTYYTKFNNYGYLLVNSELTVDCCKGLFQAYKLDATGNLTYNLYTGYLENSDNVNSDNTLYSFKQTISNMLTKLEGCNIIAVCHEMPITVITEENLKGEFYKLDRSCNGNAQLNKHTSLVGSHLNRIHYGSNWDKDSNYWFSQLLLDHGVKLCIGGHKHSYTCSYPIYENPSYLSLLLKNTDTFKNYHPSKLFITIADINNASLVLIKDDQNELITNESLFQLRSDNTYAFLRVAPNTSIGGINISDKAVVYFMVLATGYKLKSNKELPSVNLTFSVIKPKTNVLSNKAHFSQESPMFATIELTSDNTWGISLYRIVNIKITNLNSVTEFSAVNHSTYPMVTERLIVSGDNNYWYTTNPISDYSFNYTDEKSDRCWGLVSNKVSVYNNTIDYTQHTLNVAL